MGLLQTFFFLYVPLLLFYSYASTTFFCSIFKPRPFLQHPWRVSFFFCSLLLIPIGILKYYNSVAGTLILYVVVFCSLLLFFEGTLRYKLSCFIVLFVIMFLLDFISGSLIVLISYFKNGTFQFAILKNGNSLSDFLIIPIVEILVGVLLFHQILPLLTHCLLFFRTRICMILFLPIALPVLLQGIIYYQYQSPYFLLRSAIYWILCASVYPLFFMGLKSLRRQEQKRIKRDQEINLIKKQMDYSREMETEYQNMRKWNHDIENHLFSMSYLMDTAHYKDVSAYCTSIIEHSSNKPKPL